MTMVRPRDLLCLVADKNMEQTLQALLPRWRALGTRDFGFEVVVHPEHDPGCFLRSDQFLRSFRSRFAHALVVFDLEDSGAEGSREEAERSLEHRLEKSGWDSGRALAIAIEPELESWLWSDSPHVATALGWESDRALRQYLGAEGFKWRDDGKPKRPKEATERALYRQRIPRSSSIYRQLAGQVSFRRCTDSAFAKLLRVLRAWFEPGCAE